MEQMICKSCGAPLTKASYSLWKCEYCGSVYRTENDYGADMIVKIDALDIDQLKFAMKPSATAIWRG